MKSKQYTQSQTEIYILKWKKQSVKWWKNDYSSSLNQGRDKKINPETCLNKVKNNNIDASFALCMERDWPSK